MHPHGKALLPALLFLAVACASVPRVDVASEESAIRELDRQWAQAAARRDTAAFVGFYAEDATLVMPNAPPAAGLAAIRSAVAGMLALPNLNLSFEPTSISVARSGDLAYDLGSYRMSFDGPQGRVDDAGRYTVVVYLPAKMPHFAVARGQTVIQLHGMGPFEVRPVEQVP